MQLLCQLLTQSRYAAASMVFLQQPAWHGPCQHEVMLTDNSARFGQPNQADPLCRVNHSDSTLLSGDLLSHEAIGLEDREDTPYADVACYLQHAQHAIFHRLWQTHFNRVL